jgi:photosystem II stability/assembly factor-like uncharacterized protein
MSIDMTNASCFCVLLLLLSLSSVTPRWTSQPSGVNSRLRGISAVNDRVVWASGSASTVLRTTDGGTTWQKFSVTSEQLDFRDIDAMDAKVAYVLSIGNGAASRIYKTVDGGSSWSLQFKNDDAKAFYDAMTFWDANHGLVIGDAIEGQFCILITTNGGRDWVRVPATSLPAALPNEGAFAASGSNIAMFGKTHAWIGTGAAAKSRVLRTADGGRSWNVSETPLKANQSTGMFSIAFRDKKHGVVVGGDYTKESEAVDNAAISTDGGATWTLTKGLSGYRSSVAYIPGTHWLVAVGPSGADYSSDDGRTWVPISGSGYDTLSMVPGLRSSSSVGFAAGLGGRIGKLSFSKN